MHADHERYETASNAPRAIPEGRCRAVRAWGQDDIRANPGNGFPLMPHNRRRSPIRLLALGAETLECRSLLSGTAIGHQDVEIQVPSAYISQESSQLDVTLARTQPSGARRLQGLDHGRLLGHRRPGYLGTAIHTRQHRRHLPGGPFNRDRCDSHQLERGQSRRCADRTRREVVDTAGEGVQYDRLPREQRKCHSPFDRRCAASSRRNRHHFQQANGPGDGAEYPQLRD